MTVFVGIDPGATGAVGGIFDSGVVVQDMPSNPADLVEVMETYTDFADVRVLVERAQSMPKQGVSSTFAYGVGYGQILGVLAALRLPYETVAPGVWKRAMGLTSQKADSRALARQLWPSAALSRVKDHGRAEALLLAEWGRRKEMKS